MTIWAHGAGTQRGCSMSKAKKRLIRVPPNDLLHTGVNDIVWDEAARLMGHNFTECEISAGWPCEMNTSRLANIQFPHDGDWSSVRMAANNERNHKQAWLGKALTTACQLGDVESQLVHYVMRETATGPIVQEFDEYQVAPGAFIAWLAVQDPPIEPSRFIRQWCKANDVAVESPSEAPLVKTPERQPDVAPQSQDVLSVLAAQRAARTIPGKKAPEWTDGERTLLDAAVHERGGRTAAGVVGEVAGRLDLTPRAVRNQLGVVKKTAAAPATNAFAWRGAKKAAGQ